jgi:hypothetical protein
MAALMAAPVKPTPNKGTGEPNIMMRKFIGSALLTAASAAAIGMAVAPIASADDDNTLTEPVTAVQGLPPAPPIPVPGYINKSHFPNPNNFVIDGTGVLIDNENKVWWDELSADNYIGGGLTPIGGLSWDVGQQFTVPSQDVLFPDGYPFGIEAYGYITSPSDHSFTVECTHGESKRCIWQPRPNP